MTARAYHIDGVLRTPLDPLPAGYVRCSRCGRAATMATTDTKAGRVVRWSLPACACGAPGQTVESQR